MANSYWFRSGFYSISHKVLNLLFGLIGYIVLIRHVLSKSEMGEWVVFLSITTLIEIGRNGLIKSSLIKHIGESEDSEKPFINTASIFLNFLITTASCILLVIFAHIIGDLVNAPSLPGMLYLYCINSLFLIPFSQLNFLQQANLTFKGITFAHTLRMTIFFSLVLFLGFVEPDLQDFNILNVLVIGQAIGVFGGVLLNIYFSKKFMLFARSIRKYWVQKLFGFGKHTFITNISMVLYSNTDQLMLGGMINTSAVAIYNVAIRVNNLAQVPTMSMAEILFPKSIERMKESGEQVLNHLYYRSVGAILGILLPAILIILLIPDLIVKFLTGENFAQYAESVPVLQLSVLYMLFVPFSRQFGVILEAYGKPEINSRLEMLSTGINIISNYFFILNFGIIGAVYGSLTAIVIKFIINFIYLKKLLGINPFNCFLYIQPFYRELLNFALKRIKST